MDPLIQQGGLKTRNGTFRPVSDSIIVDFHKPDVFEIDRNVHDRTGNLETRHGIPVISTAPARTGSG